MATVTRKRRTSRANTIGRFSEPSEAAKAASLRYVSDARPGIRRRRAGQGFAYLGPDGQWVRDRPTLTRIRALAVPPAWTDVWISPLAAGHLQATGRDARGRKQYRYHRRWREVRDENKYSRMVLFGSTLPRIRARVKDDLALAGLPRDKLLAMIVRLLETTFIRVGNEEYARANGSFGLTTLRGRHVEIEGARVRLNFRGKGGKVHAIQVTDRRLARMVKRCRDLPGQELFQYLDDQDEPQPIESADVNQYLRRTSDEDFTAKDFRTWGGTLVAVRGLTQAHAAKAKRAGKSAVVAAIELVARELGNTVAVCRKSYIHPAVLGAYQDPVLRDLWTRSAEGRRKPGMSQEESTLLRFLEAASEPGYDLGPMGRVPLG
jgi:DNA topoisomerase-1